MTAREARFRCGQRVDSPKSETFFSQRGEREGGGAAARERERESLARGRDARSREALVQEQLVVERVGWVGEELRLSVADVRRDLACARDSSSS